MPRSTTLPIGETVRVVLPSAVVVGPDPLVVRVGVEEVTVPGDESVTVDTVNPASWPPIAGDVWTGLTGKWFATTVNGNVRMVPAAGGAVQTPQEIKQNDRPLILAYRAS